MFKKRPGTSGIRGQLYETKLLSLIYFRAVHDDSIEEFSLATNVDKIGTFDDICFRVKLKGFDRAANVFIQAKHRENDKILTLNSKNDLVKYFDSYLKIIRAFKSNNEDVLFEGKYSERECLFVIYTTAKDDDSNNNYKGSFAKHLNYLIKTGDSGAKTTYITEDAELLCQIVFEKQVTALAQQIAKFICNESNDEMSMNDELVLRYHVVLAQKVFDISEVQTEGQRIASFRQDFYDTNEEFILLFKHTLFTEILKRRKLTKDDNETRRVLTQFLLGGPPDVQTLSKLISSAIISFKNDTFELLDKMIPEHYNLLLDQVSSRSTVRKAVELAAKDCLPSLELKVPAAFGNKDLLIKGNEVKIEKRINYLTSKIADLIEKSKPNNIITIDESMGDGFLQLSGGIASAVGNILIYDDRSKLIKFRDNCDSQGILAKQFFAKLESKIHNLHEYRFDVKVKKFPKLSLIRDEFDEHLVKDFFSKLIFYTNQADENGVEKILKDEIDDLQNNELHNTGIRSDALFLKYHDEIQKWWMSPKETSYLTKESEIYKNAERTTLSQPLMSILNMMRNTKTKDYTFNENAVNSLNLDSQPLGPVIITENSILTVAKLIQYSTNKDVVVLDFEYIVKLLAKDKKILCTELTTADKTKTLIIIVFDKVQNIRTSGKILENIADAIKDKNIFVITDKMSAQIVTKYFSLTDANLVKDERNNLTDMSEESQKSILKNTKVIFQCDELTLDEVVDDVSITYVGGDVLYRIIHNYKHIIGKSVSNSNYEKLSLYTERSISPIELKPSENIDHTLIAYERKLSSNIKKVKSNDSIPVKTLYDIKDDVVLIIADPGMGKSTLLTHLSLETKRLHQKVWILRINLLDYAREFSKWQENKTVIDTLESLNFMCQVALSEERSKMNDLKITLEEMDGIVHLKDCTGDEWTVFELKLFLHFYNSGQLLFLFDGFDEICPHYACEVLALIKVARNYPAKHKIWITSRSYDDKIITIIELQFGTLYEIEPLNFEMLYLHLSEYWNRSEILKDLNEDQWENIYDFITFMSQSNDVRMLLKKNTQKKEIPFLAVYCSFIGYLKANLKLSPHYFGRTLNKIMCYEIFDYTNEFISIPLHLNLIADYIYNKIRDTNKTPNKWDLDINICNIYEAFLETKLKKIRFQEKNRMDMYLPDNIITYKKEYADFMAKHKKLAAYAVFLRYHNNLFNTNELNELKDLIDLLKEGEEKTGIICNIVNDIPMFVHTMFAEYFAVEYICDLLISKSSKEYQKSIWDFILNVMVFNCNLNVLYTFDTKIKINKELTTVVKKNNKVIFELLLEQSKNTENKDGDIKSSLCELVRNDLRNFASLLLSIIEINLDENNITDIIEIVRSTKMLMIAIKMEFEELIVTILDNVRMIDKSKLNVLFENVENFELNENIDEISTDELIHRLHKHVWTRMDIVPNWANVAELSGQIYFI